MDLRPVSVTEFDEVYDILWQNAQWLEAKSIVQWPLDWLESQRENIRQSMMVGDFYCLEDGKKIIAVVEIKTTPEAIWQYEATPAHYIHKLAIARQYANKKLGTQILDIIRRHAIAQGIVCLRLDCVAHNDKLRQYYQSYGFAAMAEVSGDVVNFALYQLDLAFV